MERFANNIEIVTLTVFVSLLEKIHVWQLGNGDISLSVVLGQLGQSLRWVPKASMLSCPHMGPLILKNRMYYNLETFRMATDD